MRGRCQARSVLQGSVAVLAVASGVAGADQGLRAITVVCDRTSDLIEVIPFILWNEELDTFLVSNPDGIASTEQTYTKVFESIDRTFSYTCELNERTVTLGIKEDVLSVSETGRATFAKRIDYVWFASGERYKLRREADHPWQECCGADEGAVGHPLACRELTSSDSTNCERVEAAEGKHDSPPN